MLSGLPQTAAEGRASRRLRTTRHVRKFQVLAATRLAAVPLIRIEETDDVSLTWRIEVPRARVWECLSDKNLIRQWLGEVISGEVRAVSDFAVDHGEGYVCHSTVVAWAEPSRLEFTWRFPDEPASKVCLDLEELGGLTDFRLSHSNLGALREPYRDGWCVHLSYLEAAALGTPLPSSMFWRLHGTVAQLNLR